MTVGSYPISYPGGQQGISPRSFSGLELWLDAADTNTITTGATFTWGDKSDNAYSATQSTGANQPVSGSSTENGLNIIDFATNDFLTLPSDLYSIPNGSNTLVTISKRTSEDGSLDAVISMGVSNSNRFFIAYSNVSGFVVYRSNNQATLGSVSVGGGTNTNMQFLSGRRLGTLQSISINGGTSAINLSGANEPSINEAEIGNDASGSLFLNGSIGEIMLYSRSLSDGELNTLFAYAQRKWAL